MSTWESRKPPKGKAATSYERQGTAMAKRQSDMLIVPEKQGNACGGKRHEKTQESPEETCAGHGAGGSMKTEIDSITNRARNDSKYRFMTVMSLNTEENLLECFWELKSGKAPGIDGVDVRKYEENLGENISNLYRKLREWTYKPQPAKRVYIEKADGTKRGLGIPATEDKIVQMWAKKILEAIYEVDFLDVSIGFRKNMNCHDALKRLISAIERKPVRYVVEMDIRKYFDTVDHKWLIKFISHRVSDGRFLKLIVRFLKSGIMEDGKVSKSDKGTPQGGVLSPILANIYLHYALDLWVEKVYKKKSKGYVEMVRYADDFVIVTQEEEDAKNLDKELEERLKKFGLEIAREKSKIIEFGREAAHKEEQDGKKTETFDFLGFTHYCEKKNGWFKVGVKTIGKRMSRKLSEINDWLRENRNSMELKELWKRLASKVRGHFNYYGITGNSRSISLFLYKVVKMAHKWINRRSQKRKWNWDRFSKYMKFNPMPEVKIYYHMFAKS
jgi:RNA-directed DNA polymerase